MKISAESFEPDACNFACSDVRFSFVGPPWILADKVAGPGSVNVICLIIFFEISMIRTSGGTLIIESLAKLFSPSRPFYRKAKQFVRSVSTWLYDIFLAIV